MKHDRNLHSASHSKPVTGGRKRVMSVQQALEWAFRTEQHSWSCQSHPIQNVVKGLASASSTF